MRCPACAHTESKVVDSRTIEDGAAIRRRRECEQCGSRFTTYERSEESMPMIVKRDGRREPYSHDKLLTGLYVACRKRPVATEDIEALVEEVERELLAGGQREVPSKTLGDRVMEGLRHLDQVAYIRFASVYQSFENIESFARALTALARGEDPNDPQPPLRPARNQ
jgi:transcriptional repressor NrdR